MANEIKMAERNAILALAARGWSYRKIAKQLGVHRGTVSRHVKLHKERGAAGGFVSLPASGVDGRDNVPSSKPAKVPTGNPAGRSLCEPFREIIHEKIETGLSAKRIYQDLAAEHGFEGGYDSVKRFVRPLRASRPLPFRRMERAPAEEVQVDYGRGAPIVDPDGKRRVPHALRVVLSHSRKGYSEACRGPW